jgi:hypothetical protein
MRPPGPWRPPEQFLRVATWVRSGVGRAPPRTAPRTRPGSRRGSHRDGLGYRPRAPPARSAGCPLARPVGSRRRASQVGRGVGGWSARRRGEPSAATTGRMVYDPRLRARAGLVSSRDRHRARAIGYLSCSLGVSLAVVAVVAARRARSGRSAMARSGERCGTGRIAFGKGSGTRPEGPCWRVTWMCAPRVDPVAQVSFPQHRMIPPGNTRRRRRSATVGATTSAARSAADRVVHPDRESRFVSRIGPRRSPGAARGLRPAGETGPAGPRRTRYPTALPRGRLCGADAAGACGRTKRGQPPRTFRGPPPVIRPRRAAGDAAAPSRRPRTPARHGAGGRQPSSRGG